jgi:hypothetical protein
VNGLDVECAVTRARARAARLGQRAGVGVGQRDDFAEYLVQRDRVALAFLARRSRGELLQLAHQRLELLVALPIHQPKPSRQLTGFLGRGAVECLVLLE